MRLLPLLLLLPALAGAQPLGPDAMLPGFDREQSRLVYDNGVSLLERAQQEQGRRLLPGSSGFLCALAGLMLGTVEAAAFQQRGSLSPAQVQGARRAMAYLADVQVRNCGRPPGGGLGTGNEGDRLLKAFFDAHAPRARSRLEEVRGWLGKHLGVSAGSPLVEATLVVAALLAGAATLPTLAIP